MSSIRFEPSVSATFAVDRNPSGNGGDLFADMLGEQLNKRAEADRPEPVTRRRPQADRRIHDEDRQPAARQSRGKIKHAHDLRDVAAAARDVTPQTGEQRRIAAPVEGPVACMDDAAPGGEPMTGEPMTGEPGTGAVEDKDQQAGQQEPALIATEIADAAAEAPDRSVAITIDPRAPVLSEDQVVAATEAAVGAAAIAPVEPGQVTPQVTPEATSPATPQVTPEATTQATIPATPAAGGEDGTDGADQAEIAANVAASLADGAVDLLAGGDALGAAASSQILASATPAALVAAKAVKPAMTEPSQAAAELAAKITPEAPRPAAEIKARPSMRATPAAEIKAQAAANQAPQTPAMPPAVQGAPVPAFGDASLGGFDPAYAGDDALAPGWTLHLAQGAAARRPDFIAQLRQHLQDLPAHEQLAVNIHRAARDGAGRVTIQLSPAELGKIHVKLDIDEEKRVTAAVTVEKPSTLELLQRDVKALERALHDAGLKMDGSDLSFSLGGQDGKQFSQEMRHSGPAGHGNGAGESRSEGDTPAGQAAALVDTAAGLVNVQI